MDEKWSISPIPYRSLKYLVYSSRSLAIVRHDVQIHQSPPYLQIMSPSTTASGRATLPRPLRESSETQALLHGCHRENRRGHVRVDSRWWSVSYMPRFRSVYWNRPSRKCKGIIQKVHVFELIGHSSWTPMLIKKQIYSSGARFETDEVKQDNKLEICVMTYGKYQIVKTIERCVLADHVSSSPGVK